MRKIYLLGMLSLASFGRAATLPELFSNSATAMASACDEGYRIESMPRVSKVEQEAYIVETAKSNKGKYVKDARTFLDKNAEATARLKAMLLSLDIQTPRGSAYNICGSRAEKLAAKPDGASLAKAAYTLVYISGEAQDHKSAQNWNAVIIALDDSGKELNRFEAMSISKKGDLDNWKPSCTSSGCRWVGKNIYYFKLDALKPEATKLRIMFTRGSGVEQREYTAADIEQIILTDPKTP